jgi:hypothetical protein
LKCGFFSDYFEVSG